MMTHILAQAEALSGRGNRLSDPYVMFFFIATLICIALSLVPVFRDEWDISTRRRMYWGCTAAAAFCGFLMAIPDFGAGAVIAVMAFGTNAISAYRFGGRLIKIGGKVIAYRKEDARPDDVDEQEYREAIALKGEELANSYGGTLTARKAWWLGAVGIGICSSNLSGIFDGTATVKVIVISALPIVALALMLGIGDSSWGYPIFRGQFIQIGIITVVTLGTFTALYLIAYAICRKWPVRANNSTEYRKRELQRREDTR